MSKVETNAKCNKSGKINHKLPIFNKEYSLCHMIAEGKTAKVYLCRSLKYPHEEVALKVMKEEHINENAYN